MPTLCHNSVKTGFDGVQWEPLVSRPATVATTIQSMHLSCAVTSPPLSNPYPQQDILRLAGIQCQYSLRPQPVVQTRWHHLGKMVLFHWKTTTLSKHDAKSCVEHRSMTLLTLRATQWCSEACDWLHVGLERVSNPNEPHDVIYEKCVWRNGKNALPLDISAAFSHPLSQTGQEVRLKVRRKHIL